MGLSRRKWVWFAIGLPILIIAWLAFRPEKLLINQRVNEAAPFASRSEARQIFAGRLEGRAHPTSGLATILREPWPWRQTVSASDRFHDFKRPRRACRTCTGGGPGPRPEDRERQSGLRGTREAKGQSGRSELRYPGSGRSAEVQRGGHLLRAIQRGIRCSTPRATPKDILSLGRVAAVSGRYASRVKVRISLPLPPNPPI